jgi:hypothetical protein
MSDVSDLVLATKISLISGVFTKEDGSILIILLLHVTEDSPVECRSRFHFVYPGPNGNYLSRRLK